MLVEHDLLAKAGNCGTQLFDGRVVTETVVDSVFYKNAQPLDFGPKHAGLRVAVDQTVLALAISALVTRSRAAISSKYCLGIRVALAPVEAAIAVTVRMG